MLRPMCLLIATSLLSACAPERLRTPPKAAPEIDSFCIGLKPSIDAHADALDNEATPDNVVITGVRVIEGFDAGCSGKNTPE